VEIAYGGEEKKDVDWLRQLCGDDTKLHDVLASSLYCDPMAAISKEDLGILIEAAERSVKDENYEEARALKQDDPYMSRHHSVYPGPLAL